MKSIYLNSKHKNTYFNNKYLGSIFSKYVLSTCPLCRFYYINERLKYQEVLDNLYVECTVDKKRDYILDNYVIVTLYYCVHNLCELIPYLFNFNETLLLNMH